MTNEEIAHKAAESLKAHAVAELMAYTKLVDKERNKLNKSITYSANVAKAAQYQSILNWLNTDAARSVILEGLSDVEAN